MTRTSAIGWISAAVALAAILIVLVDIIHTQSGKNIDGGAPTTVSYISNASPIPADKNEIALCTAMAGEMLGMKLIYMDAGSGARHPIREEMIACVASHIEIPLVVGGGIRDPEKAYLNCKAGADVIVVGNAIEKDATLIKEMADAVHSVSLAQL